MKISKKRNSIGKLYFTSFILITIFIVMGCGMNMLDKNEVNEQITEEEVEPKIDEIKKCPNGVKVDLIELMDNGCLFLFELENGTQLYGSKFENPMDVAILQATKSMIIEYEEYIQPENLIPVCDLENKVVITCYEVLEKGKPKKAKIK